MDYPKFIVSRNNEMILLNTQNICLTCLNLAIFVNFFCFCLFDSLCPSQQFFSYVWMGLPRLNQFKRGINMSCSRTQCSAAREARTGKHVKKVTKFWPSEQNQLFIMHQCYFLVKISKLILKKVSTATLMPT